MILEYFGKGNLALSFRYVGLTPVRSTDGKTCLATSVNASKRSTRMSSKASLCRAESQAPGRGLDQELLVNLGNGWLD